MVLQTDNTDVKQTPPPPPGAGRFRLLLKICAVFGLMVVTAIAALAAYVGSQGGLVVLFERQLTLPDKNLRTTIASASVTFFEKGQFASINFRDVVLMLGDQTLTLPQAAIHSSPRHWSKGNLWQIELSQLSVDLVQQQDGFSFHSDEAHLFSGSDNGSTAAALAPLAMLANRDLWLSDSTIRLRKAQDDTLFELADVALAARYDGVGEFDIIGTAIVLQKVDDKPPAKLSFDLRLNRTSHLSDISFSSTALPLADVAPFLPEPVRRIGLLGKLDSEISLLFDGMLLKTAQGRVSTRDGQLPNGAPLRALSGSFAYSEADGFVSLSEVMMALVDGQSLRFDGDLTSLSQPELRFAGQLSLTDVPVDNLLLHWPQDALPDVRSYMIGSFQGGAFETIGLDFSGKFAKQTSLLSLSELRFDGQVKQVRIATGFGHISQFVGTADGMLALEVMAGGLLKQARADLAIKEGYIATTSRHERVRFEEVTGGLIYEPGKLQLDNATIQFADKGSLLSSFKLALDDNRSLQNGTIIMQMEDLSLPNLRHLIPPDMAPNVTSYLDDTIAGGSVKEASLALSVSSDNGTIAMESVAANAALAAFDVTYLPDQPPLENLTAQIALADNRLAISVLPAVAQDATMNDDGPIALSRADIIMSPVISADAGSQITIAATGTSELAKAAPLLTSQALALSQKVPFALGKLSGQSAWQIGLSTMIGNSPPAPLQLERLSATITKGAVPDIYQSFDIEDADLTLAIESDKISVAGTAQLNGVTIEGAIRQQGNQLHITGSAPVQQAATTTLTNLLPASFSQSLSGAIGADFTIKSPDKGKTLMVDVDASLTDAALVIDALDWTKPDGAAARASMTLHLSDGTLTKLSDIDLSLSDLHAKAEIVLDKTGQFASATLQDLIFAENDMAEILITVTDNGSLSIIGEGRALDLRSFRAADDGADSALTTALRFDVISDYMMIDDEVALAGQLTGALTAAGDGEARLQGALLYGGKPLLAEGTFTAVFGTSGEFLSAVGLIGGAEARLEFSPNEQEGSVLIITTANAGRVLSGLGITDTIRQGRMVLVNQFKDAGFDHYDTTISLEEFNVIEAPAAVRAFSVLGLAGLYALVEGDGTRFTRGEAQIKTTGATHNITKLTASGGAVGLSMVGEYNSETRQVDISGNLVPVNQFSKIVGAIPLFGDLLSGVDNSGIFASQFNIKGDIDDPQTSVNAASLVPGVIRDIFSPDWLGRERDRLFGSDNQTAQ